MHIPAVDNYEVLTTLFKEAGLPNYNMVAMSVNAGGVLTYTPHASWNGTQITTASNVYTNLYPTRKTKENNYASFLNAGITVSTAGGNKVLLADPESRRNYLETLLICDVESRPIVNALNLIVINPTATRNVIIPTAGANYTFTNQAACVTALQSYFTQISQAELTYWS